MNNYDINESVKKAHELQKDINAFVTIIDNPIMNPSSSVLSGVPYVLKDNISTKNIRTTASSKILDNYIPVYDATIVDKLKKSGAVLIGKATLDELAMGGTGTTAYTGPTYNPLDKSRLIGGSSCGSAACVCADVVPFSIGSDTGDSIRKPASYAGIVGYKPTYGLVSRFGLFSFASSLDTIGCFTKNVLDCAKVINCIKGYDEADMTTYDSSNIDLLSISGSAINKKLFYIKEIVDLNNYEKDEELELVINNFNKVLNMCSNNGIEIYEESIDIKILKALYPAYMTISCAEATSNNSNLTGIHFGNQVNSDNINELIKNTRTDGFGELIKRRFILGSYILQKENQERLFNGAKRVRRVITDIVNELFNKYDGLILPGAGGVAPLDASDVIDKLSNKFLLIENHLVIGNFGGYPSITIPSGKINNLPISINITGKVKDDKTVLNIALAIENMLKEEQNV